MFTTKSWIFHDRRRRVPNSLIAHPASYIRLAFFVVFSSLLYQLLAPKHWREALTLLTVVVPVRVVGGKVGLAQACHEWDLPHDGLNPWAMRLYLDATPRCILFCRHKTNSDLVRLEAVRGEVVEVCGFKVGAVFL